MKTKTTNELRAGDVIIFNELRAGDVIIFADERNEVTDIIVDGSQIATITAKRSWPNQPERGTKSVWFYSGINAEHEVE